MRPGSSPPILDGQSRVLDLGRKRRFHNHAQRVLATLEQHGCTAEGCDTPPGMCHLHHPIPWSQGGGTDRDALMLCPKHHRTAHDPALHDGQAPRREGRLQPANLNRPPPHEPRRCRDGRNATTPDTALPQAPGFRDGRCATSSTTGTGSQREPRSLGFETVAARPPQPPSPEANATAPPSSQGPGGNPIASPPLALTGAVNPPPEPQRRHPRLTAPVSVRHWALGLPTYPHPAPGVSRRSLRDLLNHRHRKRTRATGPGQLQRRRARRQPGFRDGRWATSSTTVTRSQREPRPGGFETVAGRPPQPPAAKRTQPRRQSARAPAATR